MNLLYKTLKNRIIYHNWVLYIKDLKLVNLVNLVVNSGLFQYHLQQNKLKHFHKLSHSHELSHHKKLLKTHCHKISLTLLHLGKVVKCSIIYITAEEDGWICHSNMSAEISKCGWTEGHLKHMSMEVGQYRFYKLKVGILSLFSRISTHVPIKTFGTSRKIVLQSEPELSVTHTHFT